MLFVTHQLLVMSGNAILSCNLQSKFVLIKLFKATLFVVSFSMGLCLVGNYSLVNILEGTACAH